ncbi:MAG: polysaccharide biosynthesis C-terminal domain-containing protein [Clostridia bacterium]|nr:polysaccharide biosynthesis C-terminal domain-containing protein [Clostridia bacterium]
MAILGAGTFASKVLVLLLMPFYTSILSTAEFGTADLISQTANLLIPLAAVGICDGIFRFTLDSAEDKKKILSTGLAILFFGSVAMCGFVQILWLFDTLDDYILLIALYVIAANLHLAFANYIRAEGKNVLFAVQGIINTVLTILLNILFLVAFDMGSTGYVLSVVVADFTLCLILFFTAKLYKCISVKSVDGRVAKDMLKFSIPYIPTTIMWLITSVSDRYIVTAYRSVEENGLYAAAYKLPTMLSLVSGVFIEAWHFSAVKDASDEERSSFFGNVYDNFMGFMFFCGACIIACAKIFTKILLSDAYFESWRYVPMLVIATVFSTLVSFLGSVYFLKKKSALSMLTAMAGAVTNIILNFLFIPKWGAIGAAAATLACYVLVYVIRAVNTKKYVQFDLHTVRLIINTLLLGAQMAAWFMPWRYMWVAQMIIPVFILIFNGRGIFSSILKILKRFFGKNSKKI